MDTANVRTHTATPPVMHYWGLVKDIDDSLKKELAMMLIDSLNTIAATANKESKADADDLLNAALAKFHKDWGGDGTAMEIAEELRCSRANTRTVETW